MVGMLLLTCLDLLEVDTGSAVEALVLLEDTVTDCGPVVLLCPAVVALVPMKLLPVTEVGLVVPEAAGDKSLVKVRNPLVNTVMPEVKGASGPEVGSWPIVTIPFLRMLAERVRGSFLSVVGAEETEREEVRVSQGSWCWRQLIQLCGCWGWRADPVARWSGVYLLRR
jgi:hypothetical protein